jgi:hypothetical protein
MLRDKGRRGDGLCMPRIIPARGAMERPDSGEGKETGGL